MCVCMYASFYLQAFDFWSVFGVTDMYVCMLLSIYKHLIFGGGGLGLQSLRNRT